MDVDSSKPDILETTGETINSIDTAILGLGGVDNYQVGLSEQSVDCSIRAAVEEFTDPSTAVGDIRFANENSVEIESHNEIAANGNVEEENCSCEKKVSATGRVRLNGLTASYEKKMAGVPMDLKMVLKYESDHSLKELKKKCLEIGIAYYGSKRQLAERIFNYSAKQLKIDETSSGESSAKIGAFLTNESVLPTCRSSEGNTGVSHNSHQFCPEGGAEIPDASDDEENDSDGVSNSEDEFYSDPFSDPLLMASHFKSVDPSPTLPPPKQKIWMHRNQVDEKWLRETRVRESRMMISLLSAPSPVDSETFDEHSAASEQFCADRETPATSTVGSIECSADEQYADQTDVSELFGASGTPSVHNSTVPMTGSFVPECWKCSSFASIRCFDCAPGGVFLCPDHDCIENNLALIHATSTFSVSGSYCVRHVPTRQWQRSWCTECNSKLDKCSTIDKTISVALTTFTNGTVQLQVNVLRCGVCDGLSGATAAEFNCVPGSDGAWFEKKLIQNHFNMFKASEFGLTQTARFKAMVLMHEDRQQFAPSSATALHLRNATRLFAACDQDQQFCSIEGEKFVPGITDDCPACAEGIHSLNADACLKNRVLLRNSASASLPLPGNGTFGPFELAPDGTLVDTKMEKFRAAISGESKAKMKIINGSTSSNSKCSDLRAAAGSIGVKHKQFAIKGIYGVVCDHYVLDKKSSRLITTPGERAELIHFVASNYLHASGLKLRPDVFGNAQPHQHIPRFLVTDLTCKHEPYLKEHEPEFLEFSTLALGKLHESTHLCGEENSARCMPFSANLFGEAIESHFGSTKKSAEMGERMTASHFVENHDLIVGILTPGRVAGTPNLLSRQAERALNGLRSSSHELLTTIVHITATFSITVTEPLVNEWEEEIREFRKFKEIPLPPAARLCGVLDELDGLYGLHREQLNSLPYSSPGSSDAIDSTAKRIGVLEIRRDTLQRICLVQPTIVDANDWKRHMCQVFVAEIDDCEAKLKFCNQTEHRGSNSLITVTPREKAAKRQLKERLRKQIVELKRKLSRTQVGLDVSAVEDSSGQTKIPSAVKKKIVDLLNTAKRCGEALFYELPRQLGAYIRTCKAREIAALSSASSFISSGQTPIMISRFDHGVRALLSNCAREYSNLSRHASTISSIFPNLHEPLLPELPWIENVARAAAAAMSKNDQSSYFPSSGYFSTPGDKSDHPTSKSQGFHRTDLQSSEDFSTPSDKSDHPTSTLPGGQKSDLPSRADVSMPGYSSVHSTSTVFCTPTTAKPVISSNSKKRGDSQSTSPITFTKHFDGQTTEKEFETRATHVFVGEKHIGSCTITWLPELGERPGIFVIKTHGSGHSTQSISITMPRNEVISWFLREDESGPLALVIRAAEVGELSRRFDEDYNPITDWLFLILEQNADKEYRSTTISELRRHLGPTIRQDEFNIRTARSLVNVDPDVTEVCKGSAAAVVEPVNAVVHDPVIDAVWSLTIYWQEKVKAILNVKFTYQIARRPKATSATDHDILLVYPFGPGASNQVQLSVGDIKRLEPLIFLNDNLVDFALRFVILEGRPVSPRPGLPFRMPPPGCSVIDPTNPTKSGQWGNVLVFSSHFYKKLTELGNPCGRKRSGRLAGADAHALVARWTKGIDVFSKKFILVPVVNHLHWSLAIIANLNALTSKWRHLKLLSAGELTHETFDSDDSGESLLAPCIIFMDSLKMHDEDEVSANLSTWLMNEWDVRVNTKGPKEKKGPIMSDELANSVERETEIRAATAASTFDDDSCISWVTDRLAKGLNLLKPKVPRQLNGCDCALFMLQYAEEILFRMPNISENDLEMQQISGFSSTMFTPDSMQLKRKELKALIASLQSAAQLQNAGAI